MQVALRCNRSRKSLKGRFKSDIQFITDRAEDKSMLRISRNSQQEMMASQNLGPCIRKIASQLCAALDIGKQESDRTGWALVWTGCPIHWLHSLTLHMRDSVVI
jgi:hypothetical protein